MQTLKQNTAVNRSFYLHDLSGAAVLGATISTKRIKKEDGSWSAMTVTITEEENGFYKAAIATDHTDTAGQLTIMLSDGVNPQVNLQYTVSANLIDDLPTAIQNADALLTRDWTSVTGEAARSMLNALRFLRNKWSVSGTTLTVTEENDLTVAWTAELSADATASPITGADPT